MLGDPPENWTWAGEPLSPCDVVVFDVDGVLSDGWHRQHFLQGGRRDWNGFFGAAADDTPIEGSIELLAAIDAAVGVVLLTSRPHRLHQVTLTFLADHGYRWDLLVMRGPSDGGLSSPQFKKRSLQELAAAQLAVQLVLDDDQRNIDVVRELGIPALYVHSGYYEA